MTNVTMRREGSKLTITVDLAEEHGPSASGKTIIVATTSGSATVEGPEGIKVGLNVYKQKQT